MKPPRPIAGLWKAQIDPLVHFIKGTHTPSNIFIAAWTYIELLWVGIDSPSPETGAASVPQPGSLVLLASGAAALLAYHHRQHEVTNKLTILPWGSSCLPQGIHFYKTIVSLTAISARFQPK
jgi:hypothetical protein